MIVPITDSARWLMTAGAIAAAKMHDHGITVDIPYCINAQKQLAEDIRRIEADAWKQETGKAWKKKYGSSASLGDDNQARDVLFNVLKLEPPEGSTTTTGVQSVGKDVLEELDDPFVDEILAYKKREKTSNTFLAGIIREAVDGVVHPFWNVCGSAKEEGENTVKTYRTSGSDPNFQNMPIRDPEMGPIVRNAIRAPKGKCIVEVDFERIEVHSNTWYHKDRNMMKYLADPAKDMHRDSAQQCFMLSDAEYRTCLPRPKEVRNVAKGDFVFAGFYGSYWYKMAPKLWKKMRQLKLQTGDGKVMAEHLLRKGIKELGRPPRGSDGRIGSPKDGTFCRHIQKVEDYFWKTMFPGYDQWRRDWFAEYQKKGYFDTLAGFHHEGVFRRNEVINTPGQGTASACKMRGLINLTTVLEERNMESYPNGEVHDSILGIVPVSEVEEYVALAQWAMVDELRAAWPFICTKIGVDFEVTPPGGTWHEKRPYKAA